MSFITGCMNGRFEKFQKGGIPGGYTREEPKLVGLATLMISERSSRIDRTKSLVATVLSVGGVN